MKHVFILISLLLIKSCGASDQMAKTKTSEDMPTQEILSGTYEISALDAFKITDPLSITFDSNENRINGFAGCNRFFGSYKTKGNTISFSLDKYQYTIKTIAMEIKLTDGLIINMAKMEEINPNHGTHLWILKIGL